MRDIPIFRTPYGMASLALGQIPYRGTAYIRVLGASENALEALVAECAQFCRSAGAAEVFFTAPELTGVPHSVIYEMRGQADTDPERLESLFPVTEDTVSDWRQIYNERMKGVDHAVYLTASDEKMLVASEAYFVHTGKELLGIGWLEADTIRAVASVHPGAGERIVRTLMSLREGNLRLEVASTNIRAIRLYEKLGFITTGECCRWYRAQEGK